MKFELIPKSKAKTAWGLLRDVRKAMLAEPKRVNMKAYVTDLDYRTVIGLTNEHIAPEGEPACGTQGCVAGWMHLLTSQDKEEAKSNYFAPTHARNLLPPAIWDDAALLFYGRETSDGSGKRPYPWPDISNPSIKPGTLRYAKVVVRNLDKFMRKHERALRTFRLPAHPETAAA